MSLCGNFCFDSAFVSEYDGQNGVDDFDLTVFDNDVRAVSLAVSDHRPVWAPLAHDTPQALSKPARNS